MHAPCRSECPINQNAPLYIRHIAKGEYEEAWRVIYEDNPFGLSCGRVCHHPCELQCRAGELGDPIAIRALKRFAAQKAKETGYKPTEFDAPTSGKKAAIIGGGPAGLSAAYNLRKKGHEVHIYEATGEVGGMLTHALPGYRLPAEDLAFDLDNILAAGMEIHYNKILGRDFTLRDLNDKFDAVFISFGSWASWKLAIEGEDHPDVSRGIEFLMRVKSGGEVATGKKVVVIGGGNVAMDAARVALRKGAEQVDIYCLEMHHEMPAHDWEVEEAAREGIRMNHGWGPTRIVDEDGSTKIEFRKCTRAYDENGKFDPRYDDSIITSCTFDKAYVTIGEHPASTIDNEDLSLHVEPWGGISVDPDTLATNLDGIFSGGDCVTGPRSLVEAISAGKTAAASIDQYLNGEPVHKVYPPVPQSFKEKRKSLIRGEIVSLDRSPIGQSDADERRSDFREIELNYTEEEAQREARRCFECDLEPKEDSRLRRFVQFASLITFNSYWAGFYLTFRDKAATIYQGQLKSACIPGLHCYSCPSSVTACPIGSIQFWLNNAKNNFRLETLNLVGLYVIGFLGMIGALVGRAACGWLCPFGLFQDLMYKIPAPIRLRIPRFLKYFKYIVLLVAVFLLPLLLVDEFGMGLGPWFCKTICPSGTLVGGIPLLIADPELRSQIHIYFPIKLTILIFFMLWMIVSKRPFCRTTCPLGAFWSFFNRTSIVRVRVDHTLCDDCNSCQAVCPVDIYPPTEVMSGECIRCMNCVNTCQVNAMKIEIAGFENGRSILEHLKRGSQKGDSVVS